MAKKQPQPSKLQQAVAAATNPAPQPLQVQTVTTQAFQGPIPPPDALERYDAIIPGAAERILRMAESETAHRHQQENDAMRANIAAQQKQLDIASYQTKAVYRSDGIGQIFGLIVSLSCVAGAVWLALNNHDWAAGALAALPTAAVIKAFFSHRMQQSGK